MKDTEALIATIVRAVLHELQPPLPLALLLAPASSWGHSLGTALDNAPGNEALAKEVELRLAHSGTPMRVSCEEISGEDPALYVTPELSCSDMADLAAGKASSLNMQRVLDLLLAGKPVVTLGFAFRTHTHTAPLALLRLYEGYAATLASYGLTALPAAAKDATLRDMLVTAEQVVQAAAQGAKTVRVPYHAVVTPLAAQVAAEQHLTILKNL